MKLQKMKNITSIMERMKYVLTHNFLVKSLHFKYFS